jgi:hypothetical protein
MFSKRLYVLLLLLVVSLCNFATTPDQYRPSQIQDAIQAKEYAQAQIMLMADLKAKPDNPKIHYILGEVLAAQGDKQGALHEVLLAKNDWENQPHKPGETFFMNQNEYNGEVAHLESELSAPVKKIVTTTTTTTALASTPRYVPQPIQVASHNDRGFIAFGIILAVLVLLVICILIFVHNREEKQPPKGHYKSPREGDSHRQPDAIGFEGRRTLNFPPPNRAPSVNMTATAVVPPVSYITGVVPSGHGDAALAGAAIAGAAVGVMGAIAIEEARRRFGDDGYKRDFHNIWNENQGVQGVTTSVTTTTEEVVQSSQDDQLIDMLDTTQNNSFDDFGAGDTNFSLPDSSNFDSF